MDSCSNIGLGVSPVIQWYLGCSLGKDMYNHPHFKLLMSYQYTSLGVVGLGCCPGLVTVCTKDLSRLFDRGCEESQHYTAHCGTLRWKGLQSPPPEAV